MSQRIWRTTHNGRRVEVLTGWDRPLQTFFLVVEDLDTPIDGPDADVYPYSNLSDPDFDGSIEYVDAVLDRLGLPCPIGLREDLLADCEADRGNFRHSYEDV